MAFPAATMTRRRCSMKWRMITFTCLIGIFLFLQLSGGMRTLFRVDDGRLPETTTTISVQNRTYSSGADNGRNENPKVNGNNNEDILSKPTLEMNSTIKRPSTATIVYPLDGFVNMSSAKESYLKGFWQRMEPVPFQRWNIVSNASCYNDTTTSSNFSTPQQEEWVRRVPRAIILGVQKGGTTALAHYLYNHPNILKLPKKELHFFDEDLDQRADIISSEVKVIRAKLALSYYQESVIGNFIPLQKFQMDSSKSVIDATPNYLFPSDRVPQRICCIAPWVKLICLLRNPVDRAFSQYNMQFNRDLANPKTRRGFASFEEYIELDMKVLLETGVMQDWSVVDFEQYSGSQQEFDAWKLYTKLGLNSPVGRGLYSIQIRHWLKAMKDCGKSRSDLLVLQSEDMKVAADDIYAKVIEFLNLQPHHMESYGKVHTTSYRTSQIDLSIRKKLEDFYGPYNNQLAQLLGKEWTGVWE